MQLFVAKFNMQNESISHQIKALFSFGANKALALALAPRITHNSIALLPQTVWFELIKTWQKRVALPTMYFCENKSAKERQ